NAHFVAIKVDREERPDVDEVYLEAVQAMTGSGGWPLNVWLTPDRKPFYGGTYFPPRDGVRGARTGFLTVLRTLSAIYAPDPALAMATATLECMAAGGIHDQLGGGFHRYATDAQWRVPHFEKMLYDNAQLAGLYLEAFQATGREEFAGVARQTLDYVAREMTSPEGGFYSASDADSAGGEGAYFVWTGAEIDAAIGEQEGRL